MEAYQAIYDAVRSKIGNGDIGSAVEAALREANIPHYVAMVAENFRCVAGQQERPCVLFKPKVFVYNSSWCALYGQSLMEGVSGFGMSPADAMAAFDAEWYRKLPFECPTNAP